MPAKTTKKPHAKTKKHATKKGKQQGLKAAVLVAVGKVKGIKLRKPSKRQLIIAAPIAAVALVIAGVLVFGGSDKKNTDDQVTYDEYQKSLLAQVQDKDGKPIDGRDPANQKQSSLQDAASNPTGAGRRTGKPASGVGNGSDGNSGPTDDNGSLLNGSGCYYNYGNGGQCLAAHVATNGQTTCNDVRTHGGFPNGIVVAGTNHFNLADTNGNKIVCEPGEG